MSAIELWSYYLPERRVTNEQLSERFPEWSAQKIAGKTGITERPVSAPGELSSDMAVAAAERLFETHGVDRSSIDFLIICSQSPDYYFPATACQVQDRLGLSKHTGALDITLGCSGYVYSLAVAHGLITSGIAQRLLLITSETITKFIGEQDKGNLTLFGDAAAATLLSSDGVCRPSGFKMGTDGGGGKHIIMKRGGMRQPGFVDDPLAQDAFGNVRDPNYLHMDGPEVFNFTLGTVPELVGSILAGQGLELSQIDHFIFHQANAFMLEHLRRQLKIPSEKFIFSMEKTGNTVASTLPIALYESWNSGRIQAGDTVLLAAFGTGYSWGGCLLNF